MQGDLVLRLPKTPVPADENSVMCYSFELPPEDAHVVAWEALIDNLNVMLYIQVFGCTDEGMID